MKSYIRFGLMIGTSTVIMYFLMHFNIFELSHFTFSQMRIYMAIMMGAVMAIIMLLFMWKMYKNKDEAVQFIYKVVDECFCVHIHV